MANDADHVWMAHALRVAGRNQGNTAENPAVGCVIVDKTGHLAGVGATARGGRPHAETIALEMAGKKAKGGTAYVTLEPCAHVGNTPPCATALVKAGLARVVIAATDPDPRVSGRGVKMLLDAAIHVETGLMADEAKHQLAGFFSRLTRNRPYLVLKLAVSSDGKIAAAPGMQTKITGPLFKTRSFLMRAQTDAILVGAETVRVDRPSLTCRLPGMQDRSPMPVVVGGDAALPLPDSALHFPGKVSFPDVLAKLADKGVNHLLVEGGAKVAASLIKEDLVDEIVLAWSPLLIGDGGINALYDMAITQITKNDRYVLKKRETIGSDVVSHFIRQKRT